MLRQIALCLLVTGVATIPGSDSYLSQRSLQKQRISVGNASLVVELAVTHEQWSAGLSYRSSLDVDAGMLFIFDKTMPMKFVARHLLFPLDIAFADESGTITQIGILNPDNARQILSSKDARYALEVNAGWFNDNGVGVADRIGVEVLASE